MHASESNRVWVWVQGQASQALPPFPRTMTVPYSHLPGAGLGAGGGAGVAGLERHEAGVCRVHQGVAVHGAILGRVVRHCKHKAHNIRYGTLQAKR